jgi:transcriptional regulator with XRE-family HTH domain
MPLILPQLYRARRAIRIPTESNTVGDHIRLRRLGLKMLQREVAERIGEGETSVFTWEANTVSPDIRRMPAIIRFLGYNPLPVADTLGGRIIRHRTSLGMTRQGTAKRLGVDPGTLARWQRGEREPAGGMIRPGQGAGDGTRTPDVQLGKPGHGSRFIVPGPHGSASLSCCPRGQGGNERNGSNRDE